MVRRGAGKMRTPRVEPKDVGLKTGERIQFVASLPLTAGAIQRHGDGGMRLVLDVAEDQLPMAIPMLGMIHTQFDCTFEPRLGAVVSDDEDGTR